MDGGAVMVGRAAEQDSTVVTGRLRDLPERGDPVVPGLVSGRGWVAIMYARGRMDGWQLAAAVDIGRGLALEGVVAGSGLRAIDPTKLVVDGGAPTSPPLAPVGGLAYAAEVERVTSWRRGLRADTAKGTLRGRRGAMFVDLVVTRVITGEAEPRALDAQLGLRNGRVSEEVLRQLRGYAATLALTVQKNIA